MRELAALLAGVAVLLVTTGLLGDGIGGQTRERRAGPSRPVLRPLLVALGDRLAALLPGRWLSELRLLWQRAGEPFPFQVWLAQWALAAVALPGLALWLGQTADAGSLGGLLLLIALLTGALGPYQWARGLARRRQREALRRLPELLDLARLAAEAGAGPDQALRVAGRHVGGPLGAEVERAIAVMALGTPRAEALMEMAQRLALPELEGLAQALGQAGEVGGGFARALQAQAEHLRERRRAWLREEAHRLPVKMLVPMALFLLPALFLFILGPAGIELARSLR